MSVVRRCQRAGVPLRGLARMLTRTCYEAVSKGNHFRDRINEAPGAIAEEHDRPLIPTMLADGTPGDELYAPLHAALLSRRARANRRGTRLLCLKC